MSNFKKIIIILIFSIILLSFQAFATNCEKIFAEQYNNPNCYRFGFCHHNIVNILNIFMQNGIRLDKATVIFVLYEEVQIMGTSGPVIHSSVKLKHLRKYNLTTPLAVNYHVFLEYEGKIFDFDFSNAAENPINYINEMYNRYEQTNMLDKIKLIKIPAETYIFIYKKILQLLKYQNNNDIQEGSFTHLSKFVSYFKNIAPQKTFPIISMKEYLQNFTSTKKPYPNNTTQ